MSKRRMKGTAEILDVIDQDPSRGEVFWFLHLNHAEILAMAQSKRIPWRSVLTKVQKLGLTNADGNPITTTASLKLTWSRVCAFKCRENEVKQQRAAKRRRPTNDPPPVVSRTVTPASAQAQRLVSSSIQFQPRPRAVIEEEARLAAERRPDLFPDGPDVTRYKILKGRRDV